MFSKIFRLLFIIICVIILCACFFENKPDYQNIIYVIDENKMPVESASVLVMYHDRRSRFLSSHKFGTDIGTTDKDGIYVYNGTFGKDVVEHHIWKDGYYSTLSEFSFPEQGPFEKASNDRKTFILRPIIQPIIIGKDIMKGARVEWMRKKIPELGKDVGFDAIARDWIKPFGKGEIPDFYINFTKTITNGEVYFAKADIRFPNEGDGIQEINKDDIFESSSLKTPRVAPVSGYINKVEVFHPATERGFRELRAFYQKRGIKFYEKEENYLRRPSYNYASLSGYFYIRIRGGKHYGVIKHGIEFGDFIRNDTASFQMYLFVNPNEDQNNIEFIEYDPRGTNIRFQKK